MHNVSRVSDPYFHTLRKILLQMPAAHCWHKGGKYRQKSSCGKLRFPRRRSSVVKVVTEDGAATQPCQNTIGGDIQQMAEKYTLQSKMTEENNRIIILLIYFIIMAFLSYPCFARSLSNSLITRSYSSFT